MNTLNSLSLKCQPDQADPISDFRQWQQKVLSENEFDCKPISFGESRQWLFENGELRHQTGGWFSIAGVAAEARHPHLHGQSQVIILQRSVALNGFLLKDGHAGASLLFQGRVEPGNIGGMQLAPTVQSTESNYKRVHGGKPTPFLEHFLELNSPHSLLDELQSEEATRYLGKYNRNIVVQVPDDMPAPDGFRWYDLAAIRRFAVESNVMNTDARSVLSSLNWDFLAGGEGAFTGHPEGSFGADLRASYSPALKTTSSVMEIVGWLTRLRVRAGLLTRVIPLSRLDEWVIESDRIREIQPRLGFEVKQFQVAARGREVASWDQPLIDSGSVGRVTLVFQKKEQMLRMLVKASHEIGFLEGVQLSSSLCIPPGEFARGNDEIEMNLMEICSTGKGATILHRCRQSEEGGRFYRDENDYEIALLDPSWELPESETYRWITLAEARQLIAIPGVFSMEFRGVLAILLAYL